MRSISSRYYPWTGFFFEFGYPLSTLSTLMALTSLNYDALGYIIQLTDYPAVSYMVLRHVSTEIAAALPADGIRQGMMCNRIARTPYTHLIDWALSAGYALPVDVGAHAAEYDRLEMLDHLFERGASRNELITEAAASVGSLRVLEYALSMECPPGRSIGCAAYSGHLEVCKRLWDVFGCVDLEDCRRGVDGGNKCVIMWLYAKKPSILWDICQHTIETGNTHVLNIIAKLTHGMSYIHFWMIEIGNLDVMKWYFYKGHLRLDTINGIGMASRGRVHLLTWYKEMGCPIEYSGCIRAADRNGHTECVKWLEENRHAQ